MRNDINVTEESLFEFDECRRCIENKGHQEMEWDVKKQQSKEEWMLWPASREL